MRFCVRGSLEGPWFELHFGGGASLFEPRVHLLVDITLRRGPGGGAVGGLFGRDGSAKTKISEADGGELPAQMFFELIFADAVFFERGAVLGNAREVLLAEIAEHGIDLCGLGLGVAADAHLVAHELLVDQVLGRGLTRLRREVESGLVEEGFEASFLEDFSLSDHGFADHYGNAVDYGSGE